MKRIISILLAALMLLTCIGALASCGEQAKTEEKSEEKTAEASSSTTGSAPASTAAATTKKPVASTAPTSTAATTTVPSAPASSTATRPVEKPANLPADLADLDILPLPSLNGTAWKLNGGTMMGQEITEELLEMLGSYYLTFNGNKLNFVTDFYSEENPFDLYSNYIFIPSADGDEDVYGVFTKLNGTVVLALASNETEDTVMLLVEVDPSTVPTPAPVPPTSEDEDVNSDIQIEGGTEVPLAFYVFTGSDPAPLAGTGWEMIGIVIQMDGETMEYSKDEAIALVGEMTIVFSDKNNAVCSNDLEGDVATAVRVLDAQNNILLLEYDNGAPDEFAMLTELEGETVLLVGATLNDLTTIVVFGAIDEH